MCTTGLLSGKTVTCVSRRHARRYHVGQNKTCCVSPFVSRRNLLCEAFTQASPASNQHKSGDWGKLHQGTLNEPPILTVGLVFLAVGLRGGWGGCSSDAGLNSGANKTTGKKSATRETMFLLPRGTLLFSNSLFEHSVTKPASLGAIQLSLNARPCVSWRPDSVCDIVEGTDES